MDKITDEELGPEAWEIMEKSFKLRDQNVEMVGELESMGVNIDLGTARVDHLMGFLLRAGKLTAIEYAQLQLDWEENLKPQLQSARDRQSNKIALAQAEIRRQRRLAKPVPKTLFIPPGAKT